LKHVEQLRNIGIINSNTWSHLTGYFYMTVELILLQFLYVIRNLAGKNNSSIANCIFYHTKEKVINLKMAH